MIRSENVSLPVRTVAVDDSTQYCGLGLLLFRQHDVAVCDFSRCYILLYLKMLLVYSVISVTGGFCK